MTCDIKEIRKSNRINVSRLSFNKKLNCNINILNGCWCSNNMTHIFFGDGGFEHHPLLSSQVPICLFVYILFHFRYLIKVIGPPYLVHRTVHHLIYYCVASDHTTMRKKLPSQMLHALLKVFSDVACFIKSMLIIFLCPLWIITWIIYFNQFLGNYHIFFFI